ncbi:carbon-nitrogen hydrolase family protein [Bacterioplanoides sp.]|uniref:carbon-nitrogen hydrolase family protein n=1 Tax=Bacterioplanoides sp. TaxID=2066072 RepID=UPI003B58C8A7
MAQQSSLRVAAIQLETKIADVTANLQACERLALQALEAGAEWIALPEFFNSGVNFSDEMLSAIETENGPSATFLQQFSAQHQVVIGGSFLCRLTKSDGSPGGVRNRYLCFNKGELVGYHDKDLPTMWEAAYYENGEAGDDGVLGDIDGIRTGTAVCWEFLRSQTSRRLQGKIDVLIGGSHWWSIPENWPAWLTHSMEARNQENVIATVQHSARLIGCPVIHASHCGHFEGRHPSVPFMPYRGQLEGQAAIIDGHGNLLAHRSREQGEGFVIADITPENVSNQEPIPDNYWLRKRGVLPTFSWIADGFVGRLWYKKNVLNKSL